MIKVGSIVRDKDNSTTIRLGVVKSLDILSDGTRIAELDYAHFSVYRNAMMSANMDACIALDELVELRDVVEVPAGNRIDCLTEQVTESLDRRQP